MNDIALTGVVRNLPDMSELSVSNVRRLEEVAMQMPQVDIRTEHALHAGLYSRTIMIPAGVAITGAQIKIPTVLIVSGDCLVYGDDGPVRISGYNVMLGQAGRKQAFHALENTWLTMLFATGANTVDAAETEFTDEYALLGSRKE